MFEIMGWNYNIPHKAGEHTDLSPDSADNLMGDNLIMKNSKVIDAYCHLVKNQLKFEYPGLK